MKKSCFLFCAAMMFVALASCDDGGAKSSTTLEAADAAISNDAALPSADASVEVGQSAEVKQVVACASNDDCDDHYGVCTKRYTCIEQVCVAQVKSLNAPYGTPCDDKNECTVGDHCDDAGFCVAVAVNCDDGNSCTNDVCDKSKGCLHAAVSGTCDDGSACTTDDACVDGKCTGKPLDCDDKNVCTSDACDSAKGCVHTNNAEPCDDGNACNTGDVCKDGKCVGGSATNCDDANPCTADSCDAAKGCAHAALVGTKCDDADPNTIGDACGVTGKCVGTAKQCKADADCTTLEIDQCFAYKCFEGECLKDFDASKNVDDANPCTADACDPKTGAVSHSPIGGACDDNDLCTIADFCVSGKCTGTPNKCDDGNPCTVDSCTDPKKGCSHAAKVCDDGDPYTWDAKCDPDSGGDGCNGVGEYWAHVNCLLPDFYKDPVFADMKLYCIAVAWIDFGDGMQAFNSSAKMGALVADWPSKELCPLLAVPGAKLRMNVLVASGVLGDSYGSVSGVYARYSDFLIWIGKGGSKQGQLDVPTLWSEPDTTATFADFPTCVAAQKEIDAKKGNGTP